MVKVSIAESNHQKEMAWKVIEKVYPDIYTRITNYLEYKNKVFSKAVILYAQDRGQSVGIIAFYCNNFRSKEAYISQIAVDNLLQNSGIGGMLLSKCEQISIMNGMNYLRLEVRKNNRKAISFYKKNKFEISSQSKDDKFYMIKRL